jgi:tyrosine-protein kinase Etk/Wzc
MGKNGIDFVDFLYLLFKRRKRLTAIFLGTCLLAAMISYVLPKVFTAATTILPPADESSSLGLSSLLNKIPIGGLGMGVGTLSEEASLFIAITDSRTVMESVARRFDLMKRYKAKNMEETVRALRNAVSIKLNEEGTITLYARARTPFFSSRSKDDEARTLAQAMADFFISELDRVNKSLKTERARNTRIFLENRYRQNIADLQKAEEDFKIFQRRHGAVALPEQTSALISSMAELKAQIITKEIEVNVLQTHFGAFNAELTRAKTELDQLKSRYSEFLSSRRGSSPVRPLDDDLFPAFSDLPDVGLQYARLLREVMLQEKILEFLLPQYEDAKIQEAKDTPTVQTLDPANRPVKKSSPKRVLLVAVAGLTSLFFSGFVLLLKENLASYRDSNREKYERLMEMARFFAPGSKGSRKR